MEHDADATDVESEDEEEEEDPGTEICVYHPNFPHCILQESSHIVFCRRPFAPYIWVWLPF